MGSLYLYKESLLLQLLFFPKNLLLFKKNLQILHGKRMEKFHSSFFFFLSWFLSMALTIHEAAGEKVEHLYSSLLCPPALEHWCIYLLFCIWDDYRLCLIAAHVISSFLLNEICSLLQNKNWLNNNFKGIIGDSRKKIPPDSKPNPIRNLTLTLTLTPHGVFFPEGFFPDTIIG